MMPWGGNFFRFAGDIIIWRYPVGVYSIGANRLQFGPNSDKRGRGVVAGRFRVKRQMLWHL